MNRIEFMKRLESLLFDISSEERKEALQYYEDYFEDAGTEHEMDVIRELGSPERIAATIKADLKGGSEDAGTFTELGFEDERFETKETPARRDAVENDDQGTTAGKQGQNSYAWQAEQTDREEGQSRSSSQTPPKTSTGMKILLIALIILIGIPVGIPVAAGVALAVLGLVIGVFAFFAGLVVGAAAIMLVGAVLVAVGIPLLIAVLPAGLLTIGIGLLIFVIGLIGTVATTKLCMVMYPAICRILVELCRKPFQKRKVVA